MAGPSSPGDSGARIGPTQSAVRALLRLSPHERVPVRLRRAVRPLTARLRFVGVRPEDVLIASYPRSGSTWIRFLLTEILMQQPAEWPLVNRVIPDAGGHADAPALVSGGGRLIKTHDRFVGPCRRAVYIVRDVRDVVLSEYRWELRDGVQRTLDEQIDLTLASGTPMSLFGSWRDHVTYWLGTEAARRGDLLVVKFEEFRRDPRAKLDEVLRFLGVDAEESYIEAAIRNNSVERMREREGRAVNAGISGGDPSYPWIGQGAVMGWRSKLTPEQAERLGAGVRDVLTRLGYPTGDQPDTS
jgi:hypothetical protein